ncbi:MAG: HDIG domain-containing protein [Bacteroidetes bacterium]|jgi:putative nucleotidyltransferase with HDIG domain|nr:HDIG domain-containing protein [Bacteroidota bacterium]
MKKWLLYISNRHEIIFKLIIFCFTVWAILQMMPHQVRYKFDYSISKPWTEKDLIAPFDFAILKNKDSLMAEKKLLLDNAILFFDRDTSVPSDVLERALSKASANDKSKESELNRNITQLNYELYKRGVADEAVRSMQYGQAKIVDGVDLLPLNQFCYENDAIEVLRHIASELKIENPDLAISTLAPLVVNNLTVDKVMTERYKNQLMESVSETRGVVRKGEVVVSRGEIITPDKFQKLESLKQISEEFAKPNQHVLFGQTVLVVLCLLFIMIFLAQLRKDIFHSNRRILIIMLMVIFEVLIYTWSLKTEVISMYMVPLCIMPIVIRTFFDTRLALFSYVMTILILGSIASNGYDFVFTQVSAGIVTIFSIKNMRRRSHVFWAVFLVYIAYFVCYFSLEIIHTGNMVKVNWENAFWLLANVLLTLFAYPLIYFLERIFKVTSDISLIELADSNNPLLHELSIKAPGTFQHSLQVANIAEAAMFKIGGNALLVRVGALYHDIGKMDMPLYFIENQVSGINPHDDLSFEESAGIIISHVLKGVEKARRNQLPDLVIDFIRTHHGTTRVQYFYESFLKNYPDKIIDENAFHYPGPKPFNRETAVLMMADSVEAASRSLKKHDAESINKLVNDILDNQIAQNQFSNCDITFRDITELKKLFCKMLGSIYHVRVEYSGAGI